MSRVFSSALPFLELKAALLASSTNDLLPPRDEDDVGGEVGRRFLESLDRSLSRGDYEPDRIEIIQVPKPGFTTRPAALLSLDDRVVYEALVAALRPRIDKFLVSSEATLWPRGVITPKRWSEFESAPLTADSSHIALLDVAGYYDSIPHVRLASLLLEATGRREVVEALVEFLGRSMGLERGIPQGLAGSDPLATLYLTPVDRALLLAGFDYFRHGDDVRIGLVNYASGRRAIALAERELRQLGLILNASKSQIVKRVNYEAELSGTSREKSELRKRIEEMNLKALRDGDAEMIRSLAVKVGVDPEVMDLFEDDPEAAVTLVAEIRAETGPYETLSFEESVEILQKEITPAEISVAQELFEQSLRHAPDKDQPWERFKFHSALWDSLTGLAAAKDPKAIEHCAHLLLAFPDETEIVVRYLLAMVGTSPSKVVNQISEVILTDDFRLGWQTAWLYRVLAAASEDLDPEVLDRALRSIGYEDLDWLERIEALRLLATVGKLERDHLWRMWRRVPAPFRPNVVAAAALMAKAKVDWASTFVDACRGDRVNEVVIAHILNE